MIFSVSTFDIVNSVQVSFIPTMASRNIHLTQICFQSSVENVGMRRKTGKEINGWCGGNESVVLPSGRNVSPSAPAALLSVVLF